ILGSMLGQLFMFLWTWSLFYHMANGIRHLFWDAGYGFEMETATKSGWAVVWSSIILTFLCWLIAAP
ncbi:MAG TPA: succinate dehydrogenase, cytochrome b556 subunit, partial [Candidatus Competibacteraceae bacterium]|nr:succinate dehydrogenase, cytochrome b556 subunit [Candidatus Competibacteraceae bacterium]